MNQPSFRLGFAISVMSAGADALTVVRELLRAAGLNTTEYSVDPDKFSIHVFVDGVSDQYLAWRDISAQAQYRTWTLIVEQIGKTQEEVPPPAPSPWWTKLAKGTPLETNKSGVLVRTEPRSDAPEWGRGPLEQGYKALNWWGYNGEWVRVLENSTRFPTGLWIRAADLVEK